MNKKQKKRALSILLMISLIVSSISAKPIPAYADSSEGSHSHYSSDELVAEFYFGTEVTKDTVYSPDVGYGFTTVEYLDPAPGWIEGVYYPREPMVSHSSDYVNAVMASSDANENLDLIPGFANNPADNGNSETGEADDVNVVSGTAINVVSETVAADIKANPVSGPALGVLEIGSIVWTETESSGYGVYTYENTSVFNVDLDNADYNVTVTLVNPSDKEYTAYLKAEDITKASGITVAPGETVEKTITAILVDGQLNLKFLASSSATQESLATRGEVYVSKVSIVRQATNELADKPTIFIASDSTVQTYDDYYYPQSGWGQTLYHFFGDFIEERECTDCDYSQAQTYETDKVIIENRAIGGRSSKSFITEGKLDDLLEDVKPGDYVLVQWGHNDATYSRPNRYVSVAEFPEMLKYYIDGTRQRGATPILVTPVARYSPRGDGTFNSDFEGYRQAMIALGVEKNVPVLDLTGASIALCEALGVEGAKSLFLHLAAGDYDGAYAGGATDSTHLQYYGAYKFAQCVAKLILEYSVDNQLDTLKSYVKLQMPSTVPETVSNLVTTTVGATSISFAWDSADGSELYYIYRAELTAGMTIDDIDFTQAEKYSVSPVARYTDKNCESGKEYVYAVRGFNEFGLGEFSNKILVSTKSALYKFDFDNG